MKNKHWKNCIPEVISPLNYYRYGMKDISASFLPLLDKIGHLPITKKFGQEMFLGPVLIYLTDNSAIWQQLRYRYWYLCW
jgi:hypothetical protein